MASPRRRFPHRICALALILVMSGPAQAFAAPSVADKSAEAAQAQAQLQQMQRQLAGDMSSFAKVSAELEATRRDVARNTRKLRAIEATLTTIGSRLGARASYIYRSQDGPLDVLFGATSFEQFLARFDFLSRVAVEDAGLIGSAKEARDEARKLRATLQAREKRLTALRDKAAAQHEKLTSAVSKQQAYFSSLSADVAAQIAADERAKRHVSTPPSTPSSAPSPRTSPKAGNGLAVASVDGRSGSYYVESGEPRSYRPSEPAGSTQASVYSVAENGTGTSSGRRLDDSDLTCACSPGLGLPMGTHVALSRGGRRIIVVVTDRGPFSPPGRDFDLTVRAARLLGVDGVGTVRYEVVVPN